jgi:hypothetical protein
MSGSDSPVVAVSEPAVAVVAVVAAVAVAVAVLHAPNGEVA